MNAKRIIAVLLLLSFSLLAQTSAPDPQTKPKPKKKPATPSATEVLANQVRELRQMMDTQQQQIQQLQQAVHSRDQQITDLQNAASQARSSADAAAASSAQNMQTVSALQSTVADIKLNTTNMAVSMEEEQKRVGDMFESPLAIHYKGVTITPGGFLAAESVYRQKGMASDVNTPFNSIPFDGADASHLSEWFGSGRQSRITLLVEGKIKTAKLSGYYETDWLSAGITSNNNQSNSYTNRMRQLWGQAALDNGWTFTGGQMWSLVTETKKGLDNRTEALPMTIDAQYAVGFSWTRQFGFRVTKNFGNKFWLGFSAENAQPLLSGRNIPANFLVGNVGTGGGLYNVDALYGFNETPDFIVKAAFEPGFGHYEVFGIARNFRDRIYGPNGTHVNDTRTGGGGGANARWSFFQKHVDFGLHALGGDGVGRYGTSTLPDITVRPADSVYGTSTLAPIHNYQGLVTLEWHSKHWDIYSNGGIEYDQRTIYRTGSTLVGYGIGNGNMTACNTEVTPVAPSGTASPPTGIFPPVSTGFNPGSGSCAADTRSVVEGTIGFWYKAYSGPKGRLQFGPEYEYVIRDVWGCAINTGLCTGSVATNSALNPHAVNNIIMTSFRYYIP